MSQYLALLRGINVGGRNLIRMTIEKYRYDVIFLKPALAAADLVVSVPARRGVDLAHAGPGALYFSRLISKATQSQFARLVSMSAYQGMTIRNWNTTTKLLRMMSEG